MRDCLSIVWTFQVILEIKQFFEGVFHLAG